MKLTFAMKDLPPAAKNDGTTKIGMKDLSIVNAETGEEVTGLTAWLWCGQDALIGDEPILTPSHFANDPIGASYGVLVFRCDAARNVEG